MTNNRLSKPMPSTPQGATGPYGRPSAASCAAEPGRGDVRERHKLDVKQLVGDVTARPPHPTLSVLTSHGSALVHAYLAAGPHNSRSRSIAVQHNRDRRPERQSLRLYAMTKQARRRRGVGVRGTCVGQIITYESPPSCADPATQKMPACSVHCMHDDVQERNGGGR
ncbi:hypothetical protein GY45DRAFT_30231 [Cubamyces sp. BRFM 1775]|nr:hypothetical protein GY45DRAFT_30231 [Cubamyces sp. BRFM 1775]